MTEEVQPKSNKFIETTLGAIAKKDKHSMVDGPFGSNLPASAYVPDGIPIIRGSNLSLGEERFRADEFVFVSEETAQRLSRSLCYPNDIIFTKKGTLGQTGIVPDHPKYQKFLISSNQMKISVDPEIAEPVFVYYYVSSPNSQKKIIQESSAAGVPKINLEYLRNFPIQLPSLPIQKRIVDIVTNYDRLIDNNTRRIALLEESIHRLYKEWFVHLRFPGCDRVKVIDGVPEGWRKTTIGDLTSFISRGITPKYDDEAPGLIINQKCIRNHLLNLSLARHQKKDVPENKLVQFGDVLVNSTGTGTLGRVAQVIEDIENCTVDSHVTIVRPKTNELTFYLGLLLTTMESQLAEMGQGATNQTELSRAAISAISALLPPKSLITELSDFAKDGFRQIVILATQNARLREARDLLLPRLMNGSIPV